ncbi:hypothetical protein ACEPAH_8905 [Sanghuangporus vaninii]
MERTCHELMLENSSDNSHHHSSHLAGQDIDMQQSIDDKFCLWLVKTTIEGRYYLTAAAVVLFLDILLTLDVEIERVWKGKFSWASLLFCVNRYLPPAMYAVTLGLNYPHLSNKVSTVSPSPVIDRPHSLILQYCTNFFRVIPPVAIVFSEAVIGALLILRTCALYKETKSQLSHAVIAVLMFVYLVQLAFSVFAARDLKAIGPLRQPFNEGCILFFTPFNTLRASEVQSTELRNKLMVVTCTGLLVLWFTNIVFNVIVFMCTFKKTARLHWLDQKMGMFYTMHSLILLDATLYFLAVMTAKTVNLVMLVFYPQWNSINWAANHVIDVILTSHYFLNLREEGDRIMRKPCCYPERRTLPIVVIHVDASHMDSDYDDIVCSGQNKRTFPLSTPTSFHPSCPDNEDKERDVQVSRPPRFEQMPSGLRWTMQRATGNVLERDGCKSVVICDTE